MKKVFAGILCASSIVGCVTEQRSNTPIYKAFSTYNEVASNNNVLDVAHQFFSPSLLGENYKTNPDARQQLLFKDYMRRVDSHYEFSTQNEGCLSINGYDKESAPVVFKLKYVASDDRWLIDKINVAFAESTADFSNTAECPD
ncbi:hypothetical protein JLK41_12225 [Ectopseudomonas khazarica]|uniref:hypothetical protein n=1 Tax=Ectopseudomonas khazarica TaxID=2502979 RepID=UPI001AEFCC8E|nr:hypothetical protein [Pseudomonas khazarica]QTS88861.1 hypothetical protein JLK41_12225 [Pseudomonas khazarica]